MDQINFNVFLAAIGDFPKLCTRLIFFISFNILTVCQK